MTKTKIKILDGHIVQFFLKTMTDGMKMNADGACGGPLWVFIAFVCLLLELLIL